ncbi:glycosyltransferase [Subtercola vilae]|uniref:4,4'-diaponeurosporenoate glycosyltransferase n=1 Tax=Subtercola vilae TaxID=2056433 RepID=A0A4T2C7Z7_9MICO|nr:glycosyltransferase [Subtercola vilae]TIH40593.1 glycosyltransferase family 2 protein [Subtercola vilae]
MSARVPDAHPRPFATSRLPASPSPFAPVRSFAIVVPARNEELLIAQCLTALGLARSSTEASFAELGAPCPHISITLVVDNSVDDTARIARTFPGVDVLELDRSNVGVSRAVGVAHALRSLRPHLLHTAWIANTDADSAVPSNWITSQLALAAAGADVIIGTVRPDFADLTDAQVARWRETHTPGTANGHVHGANLGVRASVYVAAGAFDSLAEHEDVDLVARLRSLGARIVASADAEVLTSGRQQGRTPGGYAGYLRNNLLGEPAPSR